MPRLLRGRTVMGTGATGVSVDNALVLAGAGTPGWVSPEQVVCNGVDGELWLAIGPPLGPYATFWEPGADPVYAGAGTIAATRRVGNGSTRLQNRGGFCTVNGVRAWDVDRETGTALLADYQSDRTLQVFFAQNSGTTPDVVIPTGPLFAARCLANQVIWSELTVLRAYDLATRAPIPLQTRPGNLYVPLLLQRADGRRFVLYQDQNDAIFVHPTDDPTRGHYIPAAPRFGLDGEWQSADWLLAAWSGNQGESAGSLRTVLWDMRDSALEPLPPPIDPLPPLAHRTLVAPYFPTPDTPGSAVIVANGKDYLLVAPDDALIIATPNSLDIATPPSWRLFGVYSDKAETFDAAVIRALALRARVVANHDGVTLYPDAVLSRLRPWDVPLIDLYWYQFETFVSAEARWTTLLGNLLERWGGDVGVVTQNYTMNGVRTVAEVEQMQRPMVECINRFGPRVKIAAPFADNRADGGQLAVLHQCIVNLVAATPGVPPFVPVPLPPPPVRVPRVLSLIFKEFAMSDVSKVPQVLSSSQFKKLPGGEVVQVSNPLPASYVGLPSKGTVLGPFEDDGITPKFTGDHLSLSVQLDGTPEVRPEDTAGAFEVVTRQNGLVVYHGFGGVSFPLPFTD